MSSKPNPEQDAIFARANLKTAHLRALADAWTEKYRQIRREKYNDYTFDDDDVHDTSFNASVNPEDLGKEKKSMQTISTALGPLRNLPGVIGGGGSVQETLVDGMGRGKGMVGLARTFGVNIKGQKGLKGDGKGDGKQSKGYGKRGRWQQKDQEEEESEEEVGRTGAFKARKTKAALVHRSAESEVPVTQQAEDEEDYDGGRPVDDEDSVNVKNNGISNDTSPAAPSHEPAPATEPPSKKKKKRKKKNKKATE